MSDYRIIITPDAANIDAVETTAHFGIGANRAVRLTQWARALSPRSTATMTENLTAQERTDTIGRKIL